MPNRLSRTIAFLRELHPLITGPRVVRRTSLTLARLVQSPFTRHHGTPPADGSVRVAAAPPADAPSGPQPSADVEVGAARVAITPPTGIPLWGYAARHDHADTIIHDALHARAVVLGVGPTRIAIVSLDLGRPPTRASVAAIRERVRATAGVAHVFLVATHTHNGPIVELDDWPKGGPSYVRGLEAAIVHAVTQAAEALGPARLGHLTTEISLNRNRRTQRNAGEPCDRTLTVVRLEDAGGAVIAHLVNFAAHPTLMPKDSRAVSAEYPGVTAHRVEQTLGGLCLFLQGAAGDLEPRPTGPATPEQFGTELADAVIDQARSIRCETARASGLLVCERAFTFGKRVDVSRPWIRALYSMAFFPELIDFYERELRGGIRPRLITALLDGRIGLVGVSGEFFCDHANRLRRRAGLDALLFLGYCNDHHQYFPTKEAAAEGGYGADGMVAPVELGAGERMMDQALIDLLQMRGTLPGPRHS